MSLFLRNYKTLRTLRDFRNSSENTRSDRKTCINASCKKIVMISSTNTIFPKLKDSFKNIVVLKFWRKDIIYFVKVKVSCFQQYYCLLPRWRSLDGIMFVKETLWMKWFLSNPCRRFQRLLENILWLVDCIECIWSWFFYFQSAFHTMFIFS